jgi:predicted acetyltransferase
LTNQWSVLDRSVDCAVAEFFILRKYRRNRVGSRAAATLFAMTPGQWEVPVAFYNRPALEFWRKAIRASIGSSAEEKAGDGVRWNGIVLCFTNNKNS